MDHDLPVVSRAAVFMNLSRIYRDKLTCHHGMGRSLHGDARLPVDQIGDLQGGVPVRRYIGFVRSEVNGDVLVDQIIFGNVNVVFGHGSTSLHLMGRSFCCGFARENQGKPLL